MRNVLIRSISGIFLVIIVLLSIYSGSISNFLLFGFVLVVGQWEFYKLSLAKNIESNQLLGIILGIVIYTLSYLVASLVLPNYFLITLIPLFIGVFIAELYRNKENPIRNIAITILGALYLAVPLSTVHFLAINSKINLGEIDAISHLASISKFNQGSTEVYYTSFILIGYFIIQWVSDTGAFVFGMTLGKHRLFERISPKKSWEGAIGGMLTSVCVAFFVHWLYPDLALVHWIIISLIITVFGIFGDLIESMIKRSANIKDSGHILPGHGGILDRFDSCLIGLPMVYFYLHIIYYL